MTQVERAQQAAVDRALAEEIRSERSGEGGARFVDQTWKPANTVDPIAPAPRRPRAQIFAFIRRRVRRAADRAPGNELAWAEPAGERCAAGQTHAACCAALRLLLDSL